MRIFKTEIDSPDESIERAIGKLLTQIVNPFIVEITNLEETDNELIFHATCRITGTLTEVGKIWIKELKTKK